MDYFIILTIPRSVKYPPCHPPWLFTASIGEHFLIARASLSVTHLSGWDHPITVMVLVGCAQHSPSLRLMSGPLPNCGRETWRFKYPRRRKLQLSGIMDPTMSTQFQQHDKWNGSVESKQTSQFVRVLTLVSIILSYSDTHLVTLALSQEWACFCSIGMKYCSMSAASFTCSCVFPQNDWSHKVYGLVLIIMS